MKHLLIYFLAVQLFLIAQAAASMPKVETTSGGGYWYLHQLQAGTLGNEHMAALLVYQESPSGSAWFKSWRTGVDTYIKDLTVDSTGAAIFVGDFGIEMPGEPAVPAFVVKMDSGGTIIWQRQLNWSYHSMRLEAVITDEHSNIYATGSVYTIDDVPSPDGGYPVWGATFTVKLDPQGDVLWGHRWSSDAEHWDEGEDLALDQNGQVVVLGKYSGTASGGKTAPQLLWLNANDGSFIETKVWSVADTWVEPVGIAVNDQGIVNCVGELWVKQGGENVRRDILQIYFDSSRNYSYTLGWTGGPGRFMTATDITSTGSEFLIAGGVGAIPNPPNPDWPSDWDYDPYLLHFNGYNYVGDKFFEDFSPLYKDAYLTSVSTNATGDAWITGYMVPSTYGIAPRNYAGGWWTSPQAPVPATAWDENSTPASSFPFEPGHSELVDLSQGDVLTYINANRIYLGNLVFSNMKHQPDARIVASTTSASAGSTISFDASSSTISKGYIDNYVFSIYDSATQQLVEISSDPDDYHEYTFNQPGKYEVKVTATSDDGTMGFAHVTVTIT